jgi:hypothetical protein
MSAPLPDPLAWALVLLAAVAPGIAIVAALRLHLDAAGRLGAALALSPPLGGAIVTLGRAAGPGWRTALLVVLAVSVGFTAGAALWNRRRHRAADIIVQAGPGPRAAWIAAALAAIVFGALFAGSEWARVSSDAWTHEPIVRVLRTSGPPPGDPWFAGFPLQYAWIYHAWVAALAALTGIDSFSLMAFLAVTSLVATALSIGHVAARMHVGAAGWTTAFVLLGLNGAFVLTLPLIVLQASIGDVAGPAELARVFGPVGTNADRTSDLLRWFGGQSWFGNKFAGASPLSLGLAALCAWLASLWRLFAMERPARRELALLAATTLAGALLHPVLLVFMVGTIGLFWAAGALGIAGNRRSSLALATPLGIAVVVGAAPAALYFVRLLASSAGGVSPPCDLSLPKLVGLVVCTAPGLVCAAIAVRTRASADCAFRRWATWVAAATIVVALLRLPGEWPFYTVDKTSYLLWIPLALTGGGVFAAFLSARGRTTRLVLATLLLVPATGLMLGARFTETQRSWRQPFDLPAFVRLRAALPADAVLVTPPGDADPAVFLARDVWSTDRWDGTVRGYDPAVLAGRAAALDSLYRAGRLGPDAALRFEECDRPLFALWPDQAGARWPQQTPGAPRRSFVASGTVPAWGSALPTVVVDGVVVVSPLNAKARAAWPAVLAGTELSPEAQLREEEYREVRRRASPRR